MKRTSPVQQLLQFLRTTDSWKLFGEKEAWNLFKYSAFSEAFGWTLLIYGILAERLHLWASSFALPLGGSIHGVLFLAYLFIIMSGYSSLGWTRGRAIVGIFMSIVPYGTLAFEIWVAGRRREQQLGSYRRVTVRAVIGRGHKVLAVQPANSPDFSLPGGDVLHGETAINALRRIIQGLTGIDPETDPHPQLRETKAGLEILFTVRDPERFTDTVVSGLRHQPLIEEAKFVARNEIQ